MFYCVETTNPANTLRYILHVSPGWKRWWLSLPSSNSLSSKQWRVKRLKRKEDDGTTYMDVGARVRGGLSFATLSCVHVCKLISPGLILLTRVWVTQSLHLNTRWLEVLSCFLEPALTPGAPWTLPRSWLGWWGKTVLENMWTDGTDEQEPGIKLPSPTVLLQRCM